ncbi:MAG: hypothetical protein LBR57_02815 [Alistipes sp.]|jgi:hypothetical protein|nr:hypothetical protein [Alistipes sp.]
MKKIVCVTAFCLSLCLVDGCGTDCGPFPIPKLTSVDAVLTCEGADISRTPVATDLRLHLSLGVVYLTRATPSISLIQPAMACSPASPSGFYDEITELSLTCDKPIRGFAPGKNIITSSADVFWPSRDANLEPPITFGQWLGLMNKGEATHNGSAPYIHHWTDAYDVVIVPIPEGTDVAAGTYKFTFTVKVQNGISHTKEFAPITLAAL